MPSPPTSPTTPAIPIKQPTILRAAIDTVADACAVARAVQRNVDRVRQITKDDRSPVTVADFAVQAVVRLGLTLAGDETPIAGEEHGAALRDPAQQAVRDAVVEAVQHWRDNFTADEIVAAIDACDHDAREDVYWTLDPVDGTKGFLRGQQYAIALARIENGEVTHAVMGCPNLSADQSRDVNNADERGTIYAVTRSGGAWELHADKARAEPKRVERDAEPADPPRLCESVEAAHSSQSDSARIMDLVGGASSSVRLDSQCKYAVVARGQADAYLRIPTKKGYVEKIWDHAAGMLIAQEAGAIVTDIDGKPLDFTHGRGLAANRGVVCAAAGMHQRLIEAIRQLAL